MRDMELADLSVVFAVGFVGSSPLSLGFRQKSCWKDGASLVWGTGMLVTSDFLSKNFDMSPPTETTRIYNAAIMLFLAGKHNSHEWTN